MAPEAYPQHQTGGLWSNHRLSTQNQTLASLEGRARHPSCVSGEAMDGAVDRITAPRMTERAGHRDCLGRAGLRKSGVADLVADDSVMRSTVLADN